MFLKELRTPFSSYTGFALVCSTFHKLYIISFCSPPVVTRPRDPARPPEHFLRTCNKHPALYLLIFCP